MCAPIGGTSAGENTTSSASLGSCLVWSGAVRWGDDSGGVGRRARAAGGVRRGDVRAAGPLGSAEQGADVPAWAAAGRAAQVDAADGRTPRGGSSGAAAVRLLLHLGGGTGPGSAGPPCGRGDRPGRLGGR